jgi:pseudouridylate synthase
VIGDGATIRPEVAQALEDRRPVVALESTLISHGLPYPQNLEVALASEAAVRESGAVPATIAIHDGRFLVGLDSDALTTLATEPSVNVDKAARPTVALALSRSGWAATTVSATMMAASAAGIRVMATGGIGGVHRGALAGRSGRPPTLDISSDLEELARTTMAVVCSGPKAILDVPATLEYLETRGVPVVTIGQPELPGFYARAGEIQSPQVVADIRAAARLAAAHFAVAAGSVLICVPVPEEDALPTGLAVESVERAIRDADEAGIAGPALTPWLLSRIADITSGESVRANTALIVNNARIAGQLAALLDSV